MHDSWHVWGTVWQYTEHDLTCLAHAYKTCCRFCCRIHIWELIGHWTLSIVRKSKITFRKPDLLLTRHYFRFLDNGQSPEMI
jgi:hypothetical protein